MCWCFYASLTCKSSSLTQKFYGPNILNLLATIIQHEWIKIIRSCKLRSKAKVHSAGRQRSTQLNLMCFASQGICMVLGATRMAIPYGGTRFTKRPSFRINAWVFQCNLLSVRSMNYILVFHVTCGVWSQLLKLRSLAAADLTFGDQVKRPSLSPARFVQGPSPSVSEYVLHVIILYSSQSQSLPVCILPEECALPSQRLTHSNGRSFLNWSISQLALWPLSSFQRNKDACDAQVLRIGCSLLHESTLQLWWAILVFSSLQTVKYSCSVRFTTFSAPHDLLWE